MRAPKKLKLKQRQKRQVLPVPVVVNPSQNWYGPDGTWSTFTVAVGTPAQLFDVVASTASSETWLPLPEGCAASDPADCPSLRGVLPFGGLPSKGFATNQSSTWTLTGLYALTQGQKLGLNVNAQYGTDVVGINGGNASAAGGISLPKQIVGGVASKSSLVGALGLGVQLTSFSSSAASSKSFMTNLRDAELIPSLSYGFTAGAAYRNKKVPANLVLGGFDSSRFTASNRSFSFASQDAAALTVGVQSIVADGTLIGTTSFTSTGGAHMSLIDSTVPHLWLPRSVCDQMEAAFGLQYDEKSDLYLVNDTIHKQLESSKPTITFRIGDKAIDDGNGTNILLPYAAFDLQVGWPVYSKAQHYFPIRRAANASQYTLGRTLLQEAYLVVDYERRNFTLGQAVFPDPLPSQRIVTIQATNANNNGSSGLSSRAITGIAIGVAAAIIAALVAFIFWKRRQRQHRRLAELDAAESQAQASTMKHGAYGSTDGEGAAEMNTDGERRCLELPVNAAPKHASSGFGVHELPLSPPRLEMMADSRYEMEGDTPSVSLLQNPDHRGQRPSPLSPPDSESTRDSSPHVSPALDSNEKR